MVNIAKTEMHIRRKGKRFLLGAKVEVLWLKVVRTRTRG